MQRLEPDRENDLVLRAFEFVPGHIAERLVNVKYFSYPYGKDLSGFGTEGDLAAAVQEQERHDGIWIIYSNDDELSAEDMAPAYKQFLRVEECWRTMKPDERQALFPSNDDYFSRFRERTFL